MPSDFSIDPKPSTDSSGNANTVGVIFWQQEKAFWESFSGARHWKFMALSYVRQGSKADDSENFTLAHHCRNRLESLRARQTLSPEPTRQAAISFWDSYDSNVQVRRAEELRHRLLKARRRMRPLETQAFTASLQGGERILGLREALQDRELRGALARLGRKSSTANNPSEGVERSWGPYNEKGTLYESLSRLEAWDSVWVRGWNALNDELASLVTALHTR